MGDGSSMAVAHTPVYFLCDDGREYASTYGLFRNSELVRALAEDVDSLREPIPLGGMVADREMGRVLEYLRLDATEPIAAICRPLLRGPLTASGIPPWAEAFIRAIPGDELEDLLSAATFLGIHMLFSLGAAWRAWQLKMDCIPLPPCTLSAEEEAALKAAHPQVWKSVVTTPFVNPFLTEEEA
jgi:hypothetical protein